MRAVLVGFMVVFASSHGNATVLDFEGINTATEGSVLPRTYGGFTWGTTSRAFNGTEWITQEGGPPTIFRNNVLELMPNAASSPDWFLLATDASQDDRTVYAKSGILFDFQSAYLTRSRDQPNSVLVTGRVNGVIQDSVTVTPETTPQKVIFNFAGIDEVDFTPIAGGPLLRGPYIGIDDFTYAGGPSPSGQGNSPPPQPVPEPLSCLGLLLGLGITVAVRRVARARVEVLH